MMNDFHCSQHSGFKERISAVERTSRSQWDEINAIKSKMTAVLTAACLTLIGVVVNLLVMLVQ